MFKESCTLAKQRLDAKAAVKQKANATMPKKSLKTRLITTFFGTGPAPQPIPSTVPSLGPIVPRITPTPASPIEPLTRTSAVASAPVTPEIVIEDSRPAQCTRSTSSYVPGNILEEMAYLIPQIPTAVPEATAYDRIASFAGDPSVLDDVSIPGSELWEQFLNKHLKEILGWENAVDMDAFIRRGPLGVASVLNFVKYFVIKRAVPLSLFEGKLEQFMIALRKW